MEILGQTLGKAIPWPKDGVKLTEPANKKAKYDFWNGSRGNVVARGSILPTLPNLKIHGQDLPKNCNVVNILEVIVPSFVLTEPSGEFKLLGEAKDGFVAWPKDNCSISDDKETPQHGKPHEQPKPVLDSEKKLDSEKLNEEHLAVNPHSGSHMQPLKSFLITLTRRGEGYMHQLCRRHCNFQLRNIGRQGLARRECHNLIHCKQRHHHQKS